MAGDPILCPSGDCLGGHGELVGGGRHVQAHGLPQVSGVIPQSNIVIIILIFARIFGFYASGFILIIISLDR